jgi:hypothetical protein
MHCQQAHAVRSSAHQKGWAGALDGGRPVSGVRDALLVGRRNLGKLGDPGWGLGLSQPPSHAARVATIVDVLKHLCQKARVLVATEGGKWLISELDALGKPIAPPPALGRDLVEVLACRQESERELQRASSWTSEVKARDRYAQAPASCTGREKKLCFTGKPCKYSTPRQILTGPRRGAHGSQYMAAAQASYSKDYTGQIFPWSPIWRST